MTARDRFTIDVECANCGRSGEAKLSQADGRSYAHDQSTRVDFMPKGFQRIENQKSAWGFDIHCIQCNAKVA